MEARVNWIAISSLATLAVVLVALLPILIEAYRRRQAAKNLRTQILLQLLLLHPIVTHRITGTKQEHRTSRGFNSLEQKPVEILEAIFSQAHLLKPAEHMSLFSILSALSSMARQPQIEPHEAKRALEMINMMIPEYKTKFTPLTPLWKRIWRGP